MAVITFTPEKEGLISGWLKANAGGRKLHQVKAKIRDKAEAYADKIIADNAAKNAERDAAEVLRQERLAMPAQRLYDGVDLTHVPVVKTEVEGYKGIFHNYKTNEELYLLGKTIYLISCELSNYVESVKYAKNLYGICDGEEPINIGRIPNASNTKEIKDFSLLYVGAYNDVMQKLKEKETLFRDNAIFSSLCRLNTKIADTYLTSAGTMSDAFINTMEDNRKAKKYPSYIKDVVLWCIKNPLTEDEMVKGFAQGENKRVEFEESEGRLGDMWNCVGEYYVAHRLVKGEEDESD